jgi:RNA polymerase sigma-70 factor, ECF subfamily
MVEPRLTGPSDLADRQDRELLAATAQGDEEAFMTFYRRYSPTALGLSVRMLRNRALAEEVVQEAFLEVWRSAVRFDPARGSARSWLLARVHARTVDAIRREEASKRRERAEIVVDLADDHADAVAEDDWLHHRRQQVRSALSRLPEAQRLVLEKAYFGGMTQREVAE